MLRVTNLSVRYGPLEIVRDVSFSVEEGQWLMLAGPNGAGKSTILSAVSRGVPYTGTVLFGETDVRKMKPVQLAKFMGMLTQNHYVGYDFTVEEVVRLGRYAYRADARSGVPEAEDTAVARALEMTGMTPFMKHSVLTLSGGELQRTFLAQLFAQNPKVLLLDEPANHLDLIYQKQIFDLISQWVKEPGRAVVSVVHDLSLARTYGTHGLLIDRGAVVASGVLDGVLTRENLERVYQMDVYAYLTKQLAHWQGEATKEQEKRN